jgi:flagellar biogenesis protein FliO
MWQNINKALVDGVHRVLFGVVDFLPGLVVLVVAFLGAVLVAWVLSRLTRSLLRLIKFDKRVEEIGFSSLADWSPNRSPTLLVGKAVWWLIIAFGLLVGLAGFATDLASKIVVQAIAYLPNVIVGLALLIIGTLLARFLARGALIGAVNMQMRSAQFISVVVKWSVLVITAAMVLDHLRIGGDIVKLTFAILFGGVVLALALVVGLGWKDLISRIGSKPTTEQPKDESSTLHRL